MSDDLSQARQSKSAASRYVVCPDRTTSPAPSPGAEALGLKADMPCGLKVPVVREAPLMTFQCAYGHLFVVGPEAILDA